MHRCVEPIAKRVELFERGHQIDKSDLICLALATVPHPRVLLFDLFNQSL